MYKLFFSFIFSIIIFISSTNAYSFSPKPISEIYSNLTTPLTSIVLDYPHRPILPVTKINDDIYYALSSTFNNSPILFYLSGNKNYFHDNKLVNILTFYNKESIYNLNQAYIAGKFSLPYSMFIYKYDTKTEKFDTDYKYWPATADAFSVLLYALSWLGHTPEHIYDLLWINGNNLHEREIQTPFYNCGFLKSFCSLIDTIICFLSIMIECIVMIINTIIGFFVAFLIHPLNSLCSIGDFLYMFVVTTISSLWGLYSSLILLAYDIFNIVG